MSTYLYECRHCGELQTSEKAFHVDDRGYFCSFNCAQLDTDAKNGKRLREEKKR